MVDGKNCRATNPISGRLEELSAAQPQSNDRGESKAFVTSLALCGAALTGATSSPSIEMMLAWVDEQFDGKGLQRSANL